MFKRLDLKAQLYLAVAATVCLTFLVAGLEFVALRKVATEYDQISEITVGKLETIGRLRFNAMAISQILGVLGHQGLDSKMIQEQEKKLSGRIDRFEEVLGQYSKLPVVAGDESLTSAAKAQWSASKELVNKISGLLRSAKAEDQAEARKLLYGEYEAALDQSTEQLRSILNFHVAIGKKWREQANSTSNLFFRLTVGVILVAAIVSLLFGVWFTNHLTGRLQAITNALYKSSDQVLAASQDVFKMGEALADNVTAQAAALQETSSAAEEITATVAKNAENAGKSRTVSEDSVNTARHGKETVLKTIRAIEEIDKSNAEIAQAMETNNKEMERIVQVISGIAEKTKVINDIVFQTKLLSFNASVEAARAGESGKGFAVVAEEVGNLAQMSGNAAKEIGQIVENSVSTVVDIAAKTRGQVARLISMGKDRVRQGIEVATECGTVLDTVVQNATSVKDLVDGVATASQEQTLGIQEISKAVAALESSTQANTAAAKKVSSAAFQLSSYGDKQHVNSIELHGLLYGATARGRDETMDFDAAISAHIGWKMKLNKFIAAPDSSLDETVVGKDNQCALGKWIYAGGTADKSLGEFENLRAYHARFHETAAQVIKLVKRGDMHAAKDKMKAGGDFETLSDQTVALIKTIKAQAGVV